MSAGTTTETTTRKYWAETLTPAFRILAGLLAALSVFGVIGSVGAAITDSWQWALAAPLLLLFGVLMAQGAWKGRIRLLLGEERRIARVLTTSEDSPS